MKFLQCVLVVLALMVIVPGIMILFATFTVIMLTIFLVLFLAFLLFCAGAGDTSSCPMEHNKEHSCPVCRKQNT
jgi:hypothetical protein